MRVVVTGATGNLGTALARLLSREGHEVVAVSRRPPGRDAWPEGLTWVHCDLSDPDPLGPLSRALEGADALVHLAWALQPMRDQAYQRRVNLGGSSVTLAAAHRAGVRRVVVASSIGAYTPWNPDSRRAQAGQGSAVDEEWPTTGVPDCGYSRHKAALEGILRDLSAPGAAWDPAGGSRLSWVRPALVSQRTAGAELSRYGLPLLTPRVLLRHLPVVPVDRSLRLQVVHADDVAAAVLRLLETGATGPFNVVADGALAGADVARAWGARHLHLPWRATRAVARVGWLTRLGPLDPGWISMAHRVPTVTADRARRELGWEPRHAAQDVLRELAEAMGAGAGDDTATLRPHSHAGDLRRFVRQGPASDRARP